MNWLKDTLRPDDASGTSAATWDRSTAARHCRHVVAFEADPRSADDWPERGERLRNVLVEPDGSASRLTARLYGPVRQQRHDVVPADARRPGRDRSSGDGGCICGRRPDLAPAIIKLDVEGAEHLVVMGANECLKRPSLRAVVFEDRHGSDGRPMNTALVTDLESAGFTIAPLGRSSPEADDDLMNFCATRT